MQPTPVSATCFQHQPPAPEGSQQLPDGLLFSSCWSVSQSQTTMVSCVVPLHHFSLLAGSKVQPSALLWKRWVSSSPGLPLFCVLPLCLLPGHRQLPRLARPHPLLCPLGLHPLCFLCQGGSRPGCIGGLAPLLWVQLGITSSGQLLFLLGGMCTERHPRLCLCPVLCWTSSLEVHMGIWQVSCEYSSEKKTTRRTVPWTVLHSKSILYF